MTNNVQDASAIVIALPGVATVANQQTGLAKLDEIIALLEPPPRVATAVSFETTRYSLKSGGPPMAGTITLPNNMIAHTPVLWSDVQGTVPAPPDAAITSSDPTIATVAYSANQTMADTTPVAAGSCTITVSSASLHLSDSMTVTVAIAPIATSVVLDAANTTFTPKVSP